MEVGIVGLPNAGKSTLFNTLTRAHAEVASFPFTTIDKNVAIATVPDSNIGKLAKIFHSKKTVPATIRFIDIAGLVMGASTGEGLGNMFLGHIREVDAIVHVVRFFADQNVAHVTTPQPNPLNDIETIKTELLLADLQTVERRQEKLIKEKKARPKEASKELAVAEELREWLDKGNSARTFPQIEQLPELQLLTAKPVVYVANIDEAQLKDLPEEFDEIKDMAKSESSEILPVAAKLESEISELSPEEAEEFLKDAGIEESSLNKLITAAYKLLDLITFYTANENECHAWSIKRGTTVLDAAGKIHTDFKRGFIKADVISAATLIQIGPMAKAREMGLVRIEGKDYIVQKNDLILIRHKA